MDTPLQAASTISSALVRAKTRNWGVLHLFLSELLISTSLNLQLVDPQ